MKFKVVQSISNVSKLKLAVQQTGYKGQYMSFSGLGFVLWFITAVINNQWRPTDNVDKALLVLSLKSLL